MKFKTYLDKVLGPIIFDSLLDKVVSDQLICLFIALPI